MSGGKYEFLYNAAWDFHNRLTEGKNNDYEPEDGQSQSIQECIKIFKITFANGEKGTCPARSGCQVIGLHVDGKSI